MSRRHGDFALVGVAATVTVDAGGVCTACAIAVTGVAGVLGAVGNNGIGIAGIEFITDVSGEMYTYDVNTNTNYNSDAEAAAGIFGMRAIAAYLGDELHQLEGAGLSALVAA